MVFKHYIPRENSWSRHQRSLCNSIHPARQSRTITNGQEEIRSEYEANRIKGGVTEFHYGSAMPTVKHGKRMAMMIMMMFRKHCIGILDRIVILHRIHAISQNKTIILCWIPSHSDFHGNEKADVVAKKTL